MTYTKTIYKESYAKFSIVTRIESSIYREGYREEQLTVDFNPIIATLSDREKLYDYKLMHWQAQPKGAREWGIYDPIEDTYKSSVFEDHFAGYGACKMIMLPDDGTTTTVPTSVIYFCGSLPINSDAGMTVNLDSSPPNAS